MAPWSHGSKFAGLVPAWGDETRPGPGPQESQAAIWTQPLDETEALYSQLAR